MLFALRVGPAAAAPKAEPWPFWAANDPGSRTSVDHAPWDRFLSPAYLKERHGIRGKDDAIAALEKALDAMTGKALESP